MHQKIFIPCPVIYSISLCEYYQFIYSFYCDKYLHCFKFLFIKNNAIQTFLHIPLSDYMLISLLSIILAMALLYCRGFLSSLLIILNYFSESLLTLALPDALLKCFFYSTSTPVFDVMSLFYYNCSN